MVPMASLCQPQVFVPNVFGEVLLEAVRIRKHIWMLNRQYFEFFQGRQYGDGFCFEYFQAPWFTGLVPQVSNNVLQTEALNFQSQCPAPKEPSMELSREP